MKLKGVLLAVKQLTPTNEDITNTQTVFEKIYINYGKELTKMYLKNDLVSLTGAFEKSTDFCESAYGCNPVYFYSTPTFI